MLLGCFLSEPVPLAFGRGHGRRNVFNISPYYYSMMIQTSWTRNLPETWRAFSLRAGVNHCSSLGPAILPCPDSQTVPRYYRSEVIDRDCVYIHSHLEINHKQFQYYLLSLVLFL